MNPGQEGSPKRREIANRVLLMGVSFLVCFLILEVFVRLIEPREIMRYFFVADDPVLNHRFIPNTKGRFKTSEFDNEYVINSLGLRDVEFGIEKPADTFRILMLGDSFTEGIGVESDETFSKRLETLLNSLGSGRRYQVINAGSGSYSPLLEYLYLKNGGLRLQPDLVILNFDLSDVYDDIQYTRLVKLDAEGKPIAVRPHPDRPKGPWLYESLIKMKEFVKSHTRLYNFIRIRIDQQLEGMRHKGVSFGNIAYDKYAMLRQEHTPGGDSDWALSYEYILLIRDLLMEQRIDFWVTVYPYGLQISRREWNNGRQFWGFKPDTVYSTRPQEYMEGFCQRNGIRAINMLQDFKKASETVYPLYWDYNGHWVAAGHEVVARALFRELQPYLQTEKSVPRVTADRIVLPGFPTSP